MLSHNSVKMKVSQRFHSENYRLLDKIGQGGFGQVYRATQVNTGQIVAIKFLTLNSDFDDNKRRRYIERFHRETSLCCRLQHPNIVRLLDKGVCDDDLLFAVFEFVEGRSLKDTLQEDGALLPADAANLMAQVLDSLAHAHEQGVIHRDLKPANIMLTKSGARLHVKILDFGIGTLTNDARKHDFKTITMTHETLGTPSYSAPEQLRGEPPTIKSDLYVWGLVFIESLTGQPAVTGSSLASIFHKQLSQSNVPIPASIAGHPIAALLRRVLNKKSQERASSATDIYQELNQINFNSLVGNHNLKPVTSGPQNTEAFAVMDFQETQINDDAALFTGLTERKQISALCVTLNVLAAAESAVDLEVIDALHRDQKSQCVDIAIRYGAFHAGTLGDTLLFYFGYPSVSDNDSRLCARTALDISSSLNQRNALLKSTQGIEVEVRMGMHTGLITNYTDAVPEGNTPNVAMELARKAAPRQVLCSDFTKKLLDTYIEFKPFRAHALGVSQKMTALHQLLGERSVEAFGFLRANRKGYDFVGREDELTELLMLLDPQSNQTVAHVHGEAGIGKSRLIFELRNRADTFHHYIAQCLPEHKYSALYPVLNVLKYKYSLDSLTPETSVNVLRQALIGKLDSEFRTAVNLLCTWLHLPMDEVESAVTLTPEDQKEILFNAIAVLLLEDIETPNGATGIVIFEDMHWADPTSIEFIGYLLKHSQFSSSKTVLISTSRQALPEALAPDYDINLTVTGLNSDQTNRFIKTLFNHQNVAQNVMDVVTARTDGIPLFIEELVNMLQARKLVQHLNGVVDFVSPERIEDVPETLLESLQQKLDSLISSKDTAQLAATVGREFDYALLVAASPKPEEVIQTDLNELIAHELVIRQRQVSGDSYIFKHALVRDAAYESMSTAVLEFNHKKVADTIELYFSALREKQPWIVANHFYHARLFNKAIEYGISASNLAIEHSACDEAISQSKNLLEWIKELPEEERVQPTLAVNSVLTTSHMQVNGWASDEVNFYTSASIELLRGYKDTYQKELIPLLWWKMFNGIVSGNRSELPEIEEQLTQLVSTAEPIDKANLYGCLAYFRYTGSHVGKYVSPDGLLSKEARPSLEVARYYAELSASVDIEYDDRKHLQVYGWDYQAFAWALLGRICWDCADYDDALKYARLGVEKAERIQHPPSMCICLMYASIVHQYNNDKANCLNTTNKLLKVADEHGLPVYASYGGPINCWAKGLLPTEADHIDQLYQCGSLHAVAYFSSLLSDIYLDIGDIETGLSKLTKSIQLCEQVGEHYYEAQLYLRRALCYLNYIPDKKEQAKKDLVQASSLASLSGVVDVMNQVNRVIDSHFPLDLQEVIGVSTNSQSLWE
ncbi:TOMM system kinase/cyclase fusion protein [Litoribacillus peritrichatus]|uniref:TOMM system kinase/cyclase fusion protein n=1 Tax=Litoribacillus peritrichatus TaxID=718191 RepID=A0ABP7N301_9GAMM